MRKQQRPSNRPIFHQNRGNENRERGSVGSSWLRMGDGEEIRDGSSKSSTDGTAVHLGLGDEGRVAAGTNRPRINRTKPVRKQVTIAV